MLQIARLERNSHGEIIRLTLRLMVRAYTEECPRGMVQGELERKMSKGDNSNPTETCEPIAKPIG